MKRTKRFGSPFAVRLSPALMKSLRAYSNSVEISESSVVRIALTEFFTRTNHRGFPALNAERAPTKGPVEAEVQRA